MESTQVYEFGPFRLEPAERQLLRAGRPVALTPKAFETLSALVISGGRALSKDDLIATVWSGTNVGEATLAQNIFTIRKALGENACIETIPKFGYRFVVPVRAVTAAPVKITLAVLPFENLSRDPEQEYFSDGLTEEMITELGRLSPARLGVIARTSAMRYKATGKTAAEIGRELGVSYLVEGSVRRVDGQVRVAARLIQSSDQTQLWADTYDRDLSHILRLQSELARAIADSIQITLAPDSRQRLECPKAVDPAAYVEYLKGRFFWSKRTRASLTRAIAHFERAVLADPSLALAYAGIGDCYCVLGIQVWMSSPDAAALATSALTQALDVDGSLAEPHAALGFVRSLYEYRWDDGEREFRRAIDLNDNYATAHHWLAFHLAAVGRVDEAVDEILKADALDPLSPIISCNVGTMLFWARRFDEAVERHQDVLVREPTFWIAHWMLGLAYEQMGRYTEAVAAHRAAISLSEGVSPVLPPSLARASALAGDRAEARRLLAAASTGELASFFHVATAYAALGDTHAAIRSLHEGRARGESWMPFVKTDARFDSLRGTAEYEALVSTMGL